MWIEKELKNIVYLNDDCFKCIHDKNKSEIIFEFKDIKMCDFFSNLYKNNRSIKLKYLNNSNTFIKKNIAIRYLYFNKHKIEDIFTIKLEYIEIIEVKKNEKIKKK